MPVRDFGWEALLYALLLKGGKAPARDIACIVVETLRKHDLLFWKPFKDPLQQPEYHSALRYCQAYGLVSMRLSSGEHLELTDIGVDVAKSVRSSLPTDIKTTIERLATQGLRSEG